MFLIRLPLPDKQLKRCFRLGTRLRGCDSDFCNLRPSERLNSFRRPCIPLQKTISVAPAQAGAQRKAKLCLFGALLKYWFYKIKPFRISCSIAVAWYTTEALLQTGHPPARVLQPIFVNFSPCLSVFLSCRFRGQRPRCTFTSFKL